MEDKVIQEFKNKLIEINGKIETIEEISRHKGDKFNIFSILGIQRREVETHSFLLYELINPNGSHYQGNLYLDIFIKEVLEIYDFELDDAKVVRETLTDDGKYIDFTISNDTYYIAIEMKIYSKENGNQLDNYKAFLDSIPNKEKRLYYLTLLGDKADKSKIEEDKYIRISFLKHISNFIEKSVEQIKNPPTIKEILVQYQKTIKNITNQSTGEFSEMIEVLVKEPNIVKAATILSQELPYLWAKREVIFWKELAKKLENYLEDKKDWNLVQDIFLRKDGNIDTDKNIINKIVKMTLFKWRGFYIKKGDFHFSIYLGTNTGLFYDLIKNNKQNEINIIAQKIDFTEIYQENNEYTIYKHTSQKNGLNFSKDSESPTYDVFDDEKLEQIVDYIYNEIVGYMDTIIKSKLV